MATEKSPKTFSLISRRKLLDLYAALVRCRMMEDLAAGQRLKNKPAHEAPAVAVVLNLKPGDTVAASGHDFLPEFVRGAAPESILAALRGSPAHSRASFAAMLKAALAAARIHAQRRNRNIVAVFGNGASVASAAWGSALRVAAAERLPVLFVSQAAAGRRRGNSSASLGFPAIPVEGDDVVALYRVASEAQAHARRGNGPTLIECVPWPLAPQDRVHEANDAILNMERYLAHMGIPFERTKRKAIEKFGPSLHGGASARDRAKAIQDMTRQRKPASANQRKPVAPISRSAVVRVS